MTRTDLDRPDRRDLRWLVAGTLLLLGLTAAVLLLRNVSGPPGELARKASRLEAVETMRASLAAAAEAEKSAVMALTDEESRTFADQARAHAAAVERTRAWLAASLERGGARDERALLSRFDTAFAELRRVDAELLALAERNSNLKAWALLFGPAAKAADETGEALQRIESRAAADPATLRAAAAVERGVLHLEVLLAPHIAEEADARMDELEAAMARDDAAVRAALAALAAGAPDDPDVRAAAAGYARSGELRTRILALSRENTNVRSAALSLRAKHRITALCRTALDGLRQAIEDEPPKDYGRFGRPVP